MEKLHRFLHFQSDLLSLCGSADTLLYLCYSLLKSLLKEVVFLDPFPFLNKAKALYSSVLSTADMVHVSWYYVVSGLSSDLLGLLASCQLEETGSC